MGLLGDILSLGGLATSGMNIAEAKKAETRAYDRQIETEARQEEMNIRAEQRSLQYQKDLMDYQNEYNDPKEQMKRLAEAGLNPYLNNVGVNEASSGSGSIQASAGIAASSPTYTADWSGASDSLLDYLEHDMNEKRLKLENDKLDVQREQFRETLSREDQKISLEKDKFALDKEKERYNQEFNDKKFALEERLANNEISKSQFDRMLASLKEVREMRMFKVDLDIRKNTYEREKLAYKADELRYNRDSLLYEREKGFAKFLPDELLNFADKLKLDYKKNLFTLGEYDRFLYPKNAFSGKNNLSRTLSDYLGGSNPFYPEQSSGGLLSTILGLIK